jgi:hypothetical protein
VSRAMLRITESRRSTTTGAQPEAHFVDHQQSQVRRESTTEREHLLLASGQQSGAAIEQRFEFGKVASHGRDIRPVRAEAKVLPHG